MNKGIFIVQINGHLCCALGTLTRPIVATGVFCIRSMCFPHLFFRASCQKPTAYQQDGTYWLCALAHTAPQEL